MIPLRAERGDGARSVRWVVPTGTFRRLGRVAFAPGIADVDRVLERTDVVSSDVLVTRLRGGQSWSESGQDIWRAVSQAVAHIDDWRMQDREYEDAGSLATVSGPGGAAADEALADAVRSILSGTLGDYVASHGGGIELVDVHGGVVGVRMHGACRSCPAAVLTLRWRVERDIRRVAGDAFRGLEVSIH